MAGRKPKPTKLHVLNGSYAINPNRQNKNEPEASKSKPRCPRGLTADGKKAWKEIAGLLDEMGMLSSSYAHLLESYAETYSLWKEAMRKVTHTGICLVSRKNGEIKITRNPYESAAHKYRDALLKMQTEMGLTPSAKSRIHVEQKERKVATRSRRA